MINFDTITSQEERDENGDPRQSTLIMFSDGTTATITPESHHTYSTVLQLLVDQHMTPVNEETIKFLVKPILEVGATLERLSERVTFDGNNLFFDGDTIDSALNNHMMRLIKEKKKGVKSKGVKAFVNFLEKLYQNPSENSRNSLYSYVSRYDITITKDGDMVLYKGVKSNGESIHAGFGIVDGRVYVNNHLPNEKGSTVEMGRSRVDADSNHGCSNGLHAGTYDYASHFAKGLLLTVLVNPRDVVSVPEHCAFQKIRTCRYIVLDTTEIEIPTHTYECDDEDVDVCEDCENEDCYGCYGEEDEDNGSCGMCDAVICPACDGCLCEDGTQYDPECSQKEIHSS